jgi:anti-sigma regulatory factor (Ser/Thr protein kinase)/ketosteroid isomerase-like protein
VQPEAFAISPGPAGLSESRRFIDGALSAAGFDAATRYQIGVATNEAVSNALEHGAPCGDGRFHLATSVEDGSFTFSIRDGGEFEQAGSRERDPVAERGRGFAFMNLLMDEVQVDARPGETVLRLAKRLPGTPPPPPESEPATAERNLQVVRELFAAFAAADVERTIRVVDRGVMIEPLSTPVQQRTPYLGIPGLRRYLQDLDETWQEFEVTVQELSAAGDHVLARGRIHARQQNVVADDAASFLVRLRDAKIVWLKVYRSHDEALADAGR